MILVRFGLSWDFWLKVVQVAPVKGKSTNQIELSWGDERSCFWINVPSRYQSGMKKLVLCNHGQGPEKDSGYGKS